MAEQHDDEERKSGTAASLAAAVGGAELVDAFLCGTQDTLAVLDDAGTFFEFVTGSAYVGKDPADVIGKRVADIVPPHINAQILGAIRASVIGGPPVEVDHLRPSPAGMRNVRARVVRLQDGRVLAHIHDVTDAARSEAAAKESYERYRLIARATTDAIYDWDVPADVTVWNDQLATTFGYDDNRTTLDWWLERVHPDDREAVSASARACMLDTKDTIWTGTFRFRRKDGVYRDVLDRAFMMRDAGGRCVRVVGSFLDVTERKRIEQKLERSERIVAASTLAASVGHEINGPLTYVAGNIALALDELASPTPPSPQQLQKLLRDAKLGADRLAAIVRELRAFTRDAGGDDVVDLNDVVGASIKMLDAGLRRRAEINLKSSGDVFVDGNAHRLGQVVTNVLTNALQAVDDGDDGSSGGDGGGESDTAGEVRITLGARGENVVLVVEDNGHGVSADEAGQLFDPLFTTRTASGGTGLGLAVAHAVVVAHHGHIEAAPRKPRGTIFTITLPRSSRRTRPTARAEAAPAPAAAVTTRSRVLVVDDDALTLDLVAAILNAHDVTKAQSGEQALQALAHKDFDIVLSDVVMPAFDGVRLRDAVKALGRPIKFAFFTGGTDQAPVMETEPCLSKPFTPEALRRFVREL